MTELSCLADGKNRGTKTPSANATKKLAATASSVRTSKFAPAACTGIGFAAGLERLVLALPEGAADAVPGRAFVVAIGDDGRAEALRLLRELRQAGLPAQMELEARGMKSQMKRADRLQARIVLIVGGDELARGEVTVRDMRTGDQRAVPRNGVIEAAMELLR